MSFIDSIEFECRELYFALDDIVQIIIPVWRWWLICWWLILVWCLGLYAKELHEDHAPASELFIILAMHVGLVGIVFLT